MRIAIIQGHPDPDERHFGHALADAYAAGAEAAGHEVRRIEVAQLEFAFLRSKREWETQAPAAAIQKARHDMQWAEHIVILFPLWMGTMPALLKAFFEQVFRPGMTKGEEAESIWSRPLKGRSARVIVTMGMPALAYRWYFFNAGVSNLKRLILRFTGVSPARQTLIGMVDKITDGERQHILAHMQTLGRKAR